MSVPFEPYRWWEEDEDQELRVNEVLMCFVFVRSLQAQNAASGSRGDTLQQSLEEAMRQACDALRWQVVDEMYEQSWGEQASLSGLGLVCQVRAEKAQSLNPPAKPEMEEKHGLDCAPMPTPTEEDYERVWGSLEADLCHC